MIIISLSLLAFGCTMERRQKQPPLPEIKFKGGFARIKELCGEIDGEPYCLEYETKTPTAF